MLSRKFMPAQVGQLAAGQVLTIKLAEPNEKFPA